MRVLKSNQRENSQSSKKAIQLEIVFHSQLKVVFRRVGNERNLLYCVQACFVPLLQGNEASLKNPPRLQSFHLRQSHLYEVLRPLR